MLDVSAAEVRRGDWLADGRRVEAVRVSGELVRLAVRRPSWRCRKLVPLHADAPVRVWRIAQPVAS